MGAKERNYMQLEKDMVNRFYEITKQEVKQIEAELLNMDRQMEMLERDPRVHIKVHEQKVQNLEYEHKNSKRTVTQEGDMGIQKERDIHTDNVMRMNREKIDIKRELKDQQLAKVEDHEIEERKNQHINELLFNHQEAFDEIKTYYNDITHDNLQLIRELKDEITGMREREKTNQKRMALLTQENKDLSEPLLKKQEEQRELEEKLKSYTKDKMALKNLKAHNKQLEERIAEAKQDYRGTEEKFRKIEKERDDLFRRFQKAVREIQRRAELGKNSVLEKKLELLQSQFDEKQAQLTQVLAAAKLDPSVVASVTKKLEQVLGAKNRQIKDLQYQVHQCTKAYNDC